MSKPLDELGGKCPYMPFLDRGQMSEGEHVRPPSDTDVQIKKAESRWKRKYMFCIRSLINKLIIRRTIPYNSVGPVLNS